MPLAAPRDAPCAHRTHPAPPFAPAPYVRAADGQRDEEDNKVRRFRDFLTYVRVRRMRRCSGDQRARVAGGALRMRVCVQASARVCAPCEHAAVCAYVYARTRCFPRILVARRVAPASETWARVSSDDSGLYKRKIDEMMTAEGSRLLVDIAVRQACGGREGGAEARVGQGAGLGARASPRNACTPLLHSVHARARAQLLAHARAHRLELTPALLPSLRCPRALLRSARTLPLFLCALSACLHPCQACSLSVSGYVSLSVSPSLCLSLSVSPSWLYLPLCLSLVPMSPSLRLLLAYISLSVSPSCYISLSVRLSLSPSCLCLPVCAYSHRQTQNTFYSRTEHIL